MHYLVFVFADAAGFGFTAPDVPGFTAHVETADIDAAIAEARHVLTAHLAAMVDAVAALPVARPLAALRADPTLKEDFAEAVTTVLLPALLPAGRTRRVNLSFDENTLSLIDGAAKARGLTRSAFLSEAARQLA